jgi:hypothetical protein
MSATDREMVVNSLPPESELRQAISELRHIRWVGDMVALEVLLQVFDLVFKVDDGQQPTNQ